MTEPAPHVVVRGEALLVVDPEVADLGVTVRARARDRESALQRCAARQHEVAAVLEATAGLEAAETAAVAVHPEAADGLPASVATVHTRVTVPPDAVGELVVALARLDDVEVSGPVWRLRPGSPAVERARLAAVDDAVQRARQYAAAFGARLSAVLEIRDAGLSDGARVAGAMAAVARFEASELRLDLTPARQDVHGAVEVRFAMTEPDAAVWNPEERRG